VNAGTVSPVLQWAAKILDEAFAVYASLPLSILKIELTLS
jgi:hypothetical protein